MTLNILWWVAFFVFGLALQQALPGTDVLVAGLFLALQERRPMVLSGEGKGLGYGAWRHELCKLYLRQRTGAVSGRL